MKKDEALKKGTTIPCGIYVKAGEYVYNNFGASLRLHCVFINSNKKEDKTSAWSGRPEYVNQLSTEEDVFIDRITLTTNQNPDSVEGQIRVGTVETEKNASGQEVPKAGPKGNIIPINMIGYLYNHCNHFTSNGNYNYFIPKYIYTWSKDEEKTKTSNFSFDPYNIRFYPHSLGSSKLDWAPTSGLLNHQETGDNFGDIPAYFEVSGTLSEAATERIMRVGNCEITIEPHEEEYNFYWNSKNGFVGTKGSGSILTPIPYRGKSYGALPIGENNPSGLEGLTLKYNYWYY